MKVWITRAEPGAGRTAGRLRALGHEPLVAPLLEVHPLPAVIDLDGVAALAFTSANGVAAFAALSAERALPVFAVGAATAQAARDAGFARATSADGDVAALARRIAAAAPQGEVLAPGPREPAGDLVGDLAILGVKARAATLYETRPTGTPMPEGAEAVLVHSPKAALELARALERDAGRLQAYCISEAAAAPLATLPLARLAVAAQPDEASLLALLP
jgi:uroporphyrinogen-III synthase